MSERPPPGAGPPGPTEGEDSEPDSPPPAPLVRTTTAWLEDSFAPPRVVDRQRSLNAEEEDAGPAAVVDSGDAERAGTVESAVVPGSSPERAMRTTSSPTMGLRLDVPPTVPSPERLAAGRGGRDRTGGRSARGTAGMALDVDAAPRVGGMGAAGPSPYAPGEMDELTRFGSSRDVGGVAFDLFASTGSGGPGGPAPRATAATGGGSGRDGGGEAGDVDMFETIVKGSARKGLPFGVSTPLPPAAKAAAKAGKAGKERKVARFENTFVPVDFPGRRTGDREDDDIGSSDDDDGRGTIHKLLAGIFRRWSKNDGGAGEESPGARQAAKPPLADAAEHFGHRDAVQGPRGPPKAPSKWSLRRINAPVSSWHLGTSAVISPLWLTLLRLLLLLAVLGDLVAVCVVGLTASEPPGHALATSSAPYVHVGLIAFLLVATISSVLHLRQPTREIRDRLVWKAGAVLFHATLVMSAVELLRFIALCAVPGLRPSSGGAAAVFNFTSVYAQEEYLIVVVSFVEFVVNNVPLRAAYAVFPLVATAALVALRIAVSPEVPVVATGAASLVITLGAGAGILVAHGLQRKSVKHTLDKDSMADYVGKEFDPGEYADDDNVAYESPHASQSGSTGPNRV